MRYLLRGVSVASSVTVRIFVNGWRNQARSAFVPVVISFVDCGSVRLPLVGVRVLLESSRRAQSSGI